MVKKNVIEELNYVFEILIINNCCKITKHQNCMLYQNHKYKHLIQNTGKTIYLGR